MWVKSIQIIKTDLTIITELHDATRYKIAIKSFQQLLINVSTLQP